MYVRLCGMTLLLIVLELADAITDRDPAAMDATFRQRYVSMLCARVCV